MSLFNRRPLSASRGEEGQALVILALALVGIIGLAVDVGHRMWARTDQQKAADAAAIAGVNHYLDTQDKAASLVVAQQYAAANGYASGVTVNWSPTSGNSAGNPDALEVTIAKPLTKFFIGVVYTGDWNVTARAVAVQTTKSEGFGVITLNPNQCNSLLMDSNAKLTVHNGGAFVNSSCENAALRADSNAKLNTDITSITGNYSSGSNAVLNPAPKIHQAPVPDPFASIPTPPLAANAPVAPIKTAGPGSSTPAACNAGGTATYTQGTWQFHPGRYLCKLHLSSNTVARFKTGNYVFEGGFEASSNNTITWERGIYVTMGFGFKLESNANVIDPTDGAPKGILLYNTCKNACGNAGLFILNSNTSLAVTPFGAPYANILIWQDRNADELMDFNSNTFTSPGAVYAKSAHVSFNSNSNVPLQFVADTVDLDSNANIDVDVASATKVHIKTYSFVE
ncbi:MAG: pilus assembly protein TadG-related protein [Dehalococcoidia bacterium]